MVCVCAAMPVAVEVAPASILPCPRRSRLNPRPSRVGTPLHIPSLAHCHVGSLDHAAGLPTKCISFCFVFTCERGPLVPQTKIRVMLMEASLLKSINSVGSAAGAASAPPVPWQSPFLHTLLLPFSLSTFGTTQRHRRPSFFRPRMRHAGTRSRRLPASTRETAPALARYACRSVLAVAHGPRRLTRAHGPVTAQPLSQVRVYRPLMGEVTPLAF